jgi:hypothetical protein
MDQTILLTRFMHTEQDGGRNSFTMIGLNKPGQVSTIVAIPILAGLNHQYVLV